jgi:DNA-binding NarL/FixJ family response regulator
MNHRSFAPASTLPATRNLRIFLVEDSQAVRDLLIQNLTNIPGIELSGYAKEENEALEKLLHHSCDVLILDIRLKEGNGMSLLRSLANFPQINIDIKIIFTNNASETYRRASSQYGVEHFFDKSTDFLQLRSLMHKLANSTVAS